MTITRVGSNSKYAEGWDKAFGKKKTSQAKKKAAPKKAAGKKAVAKKKKKARS